MLHYSLFFRACARLCELLFSLSESLIGPVDLQATDARLHPEPLCPYTVSVCCLIGTLWNSNQRGCLQSTLILYWTTLRQVFITCRHERPAACSRVAPYLSYGCKSGADGNFWAEVWKWNAVNLIVLMLQILRTVCHLPTRWLQNDVSHVGNRASSVWCWCLWMCLTWVQPVRCLCISKHK